MPQWKVAFGNTGENGNLNVPVEVTFGNVGENGDPLYVS